MPEALMQLSLETRSQHVSTWEYKKHGYKTEVVAYMKYLCWNCTNSADVETVQMVSSKFFGDQMHLQIVRFQSYKFQVTLSDMYLMNLDTTPTSIYVD